MYIHSQNKNIIIISDNITDIYVKESNLIIEEQNKRKVNMVDDKKYYYLYCSTVNGENINLGEYSSIERCREILNEILDLYQDIMISNCNSNSIYRMPEE